jgi:hypothetical protein
MSSCFRTNVVHVKAPEGKFESFYKKANQLDLVKGIYRLKADIDEMKPNLVIGLGNGALFALTGKKGIDKYRGSILSSVLRKEQKVICTYSHGFALKVYEAKAVIEMDFAKCAGDAAFPELNLPQREFFLNPEDHVLEAIGGGTSPSRGSQRRHRVWLRRVDREVEAPLRGVQRSSGSCARHPLGRPIPTSLHPSALRERHQEDLPEWDV